MLLILRLRRPGGEAVSPAVPHGTFPAVVAVSRPWQGCELPPVLCVQGVVLAWPGQGVCPGGVNDPGQCE